MSARPGWTGVGSREETGLAGGRAAREKPGREEGGEERRRRRGPRAPRSAANPTRPAACRLHRLGKLRASPGLSRPPASGPERPHRGQVLSGPGRDSPRPSSAAFAFCFFRGGNLCGASAAADPRGGAGGGEQRPLSDGKGRRGGFAAAAAAAMVSPAVLRPGPGKRRLRGDGARSPAEPRATRFRRSCSRCGFSHTLPLPEPEPGAGAGQGRGLERRGLVRLQKACAAQGGACGPFQVGTIKPLLLRGLPNSKSNVPAVSLFPVPALSAG